MLPYAVRLAGVIREQVMQRIGVWWLLGWLGFCGWQPVLAENAVRIGLSLPSARQAFLMWLQEEAQQYAIQSHGYVQLVVAPPPVSADAAAQAAAVRLLLRQQVQALVIDPIDTAGLLPVLQEALQQGVRVINVDNKLDARLLADNGLSVPYVGPGNYRGATLVADYVLQRLDPESVVGIIDGPLETTNNRARREAFLDAIRRHHMQLAAIQEGRWDVASGYVAAKALLTRHPQVEALLCANDMMAIGAYQAASALGRQVLISGYDHVPAVGIYLRNGQVMATVDQHPDRQIGSALALAVQAVTQQQAQESLPGIVQTPVGLVIHE